MFSNTYPPCPRSISPLPCSNPPGARWGTPGPVVCVCLHGFGSSKEDYHDFILHPACQARSVVAYNAPGCGESFCSDLSRISIPFLVRIALTVSGSLPCTSSVIPSRVDLPAAGSKASHLDRVCSFGHRGQPGLRRPQPGRVSGQIHRENQTRSAYSNALYSGVCHQSAP